MYLNILVLPFLSFFFLGCFGNLIGKWGATRFATTLIGLTFLLSVRSFYEVGISGATVSYKVLPWFSILHFNVFWGFLFDTVTVVMLIVITSISFFVHLYSTSYMELDPHLIRFMSYLSLFTFFMLILVTADNFIQMFVG